MKKKWFKRLVRIAVYGILAILLLDIVVHAVSRTAWFNTQVRTFLEKSLNRDVKLSKIAANFRGISVEGLAVAEQGGFEKGTFLQAEHLRISFSLFHLLHAHAKVKQLILTNVTARVAVFSDGTTSWADLITTQDATLSQEPEDGPSAFYLTAQHIQLENLRLMYADFVNSRFLDIDNLMIGVKHFNMREPFSFYLQARIRPTVQKAPLDLPLALRATVDLKNMDLNKATAHIKPLTASYQNASLTIIADVENFKNPHANLKFHLRNFSADTLTPIVTVPPFMLKTATASLKLAANLEKSALTLHHFSLEAPGLTTQAKGGLLYANPQQLKYNATVESNIILGEVGRWFTALAEPYRLVGTIGSTLHATQEKINGEITLQGIGGKVPQMGNLSDIDATLKGLETMNLKEGNLAANIAGKLNGRPFIIDAVAKQTSQKIETNLTVTAEEVMFRLPTDNIPSQSSTAEKAQATPWPLPPIDVKANIQLGKVDVPYFYGNNVSFTANLEDLTPDLKQAHGTMRLQTGAGIIQDIYKLTDATPLTKVLFLSLNVTGKVFNALNVFGVLSSIGNEISAEEAEDKSQQATVKTQTILGPDGEPLEINVVETDKKVSGEMEYDKFDTEVNFVRGLATIKEGTFVSPMMSLRLDGTTDFNTQQIDMTVHAAPGRHEVDGMMPLSLKIGGTIDNPQGDMQLLGSMSSLVTQGITKNVVSRQVGKGIKGFFGLFTKDKKEDEIQQETPSSSNEKGAAKPLE